ncbi:sugar phosphate isomerase/epimerase family protein [Runella slithyformis]|uniref:Xylose isomerase domain-containing protein TIM barrel n=1 Tax=Runella slithyformis (strain ATCC 29530 / DSM 19594 / LMG 11500 / NCIMB 11436 / LSU 4) TaxID=761193 RepID=A0A7U3ZH44_RUNSL|nr:TIM barrel protein [Runella slithyformis]AEI47090.1 Xylose isomerase domain-containing protein TIM barrel [Runella slithyformis DSM 19594]
MSEKLPFRFGSEVYTWFMSGNGTTHQGRLGHMIEIIAQAGFTGIQPIFTWMGELVDPDRLEAKLKEQGIQLAAVALALEWNGTEETQSERLIANNAISLLERFPGAVLNTVQIPTGRHELEARRRSLVNIVNTVSARAKDKGIPCSFHPNSPHTSIIRTEEDYKVVLESLDTTVTGWTPDVGHIINGDMDPLSKMKEYASLINHVHYKDWDGNPEFTLMGSGKVDLLSITQWLKDINYGGWIICEDEGKEALDDPDFVTLHDGRWIQNDLIPGLK